MPLIPADYVEKLNYESGRNRDRQFRPPVVMPRPLYSGMNNRGISAGASMSQYYRPTPTQNTFSGMPQSSFSNNATLPVPFTPQPPMTAPTSINDQSGDYNELMNYFRNYMNTPSATYDPYSAESAKYQRSDELGKAFAGAEEWSRTGGYSDADTAAIRARGVSPIRSVYANAQRNLERQKALSGGYSPNFAAATGKFAREMSDQLSNATTNVNAELAQMIARGKESGLGRLSELANIETGRQTDINRENVAARNRASEVNATRRMEAERANEDRIARALQGMTSLYGTTPGRARMFGDQVMQQNELGQRQREFSSNEGFRNRQYGDQTGLELIRMLMEGYD